MPRLFLFACLFALLPLGGCDLLGLESGEKIAAARDAEGRAIGAACRHAGRALEDCYALNKRADKASVFAGWREMNDYMRENKIDSVAPALTTQVAAARPAGEAAGEASAKPARTDDAGTGAKPPAEPKQGS